MQIEYDHQHKYPENNIRISEIWPGLKNTLQKFLLLKNILNEKGEKLQNTLPNLEDGEY